MILRVKRVQINFYFSAHFPPVGSEKVLLSGLRANTSVPPRVGAVKVWYKIPQKDSWSEVQCPADVPIG